MNVSLFAGPILDEARAVFARLDEKVVRFGTNDARELERHIQRCGNVFPSVAALVTRKVDAGEPAVMPPPGSTVA